MIYSNQTISIINGDRLMCVIEKPTQGVAWCRFIIFDKNDKHYFTTIKASFKETDGKILGTMYDNFEKVKQFAINMLNSNKNFSIVVGKTYLITR